jgi:small subunit ribosomal protein S2
MTAETVNNNANATSNPTPPEPFAVPEDDLPAVSLRALIDAGVHFGHQTNRWNPRMAPFIYGARNGIHIIDLDQTVRLFRRAVQFVAHTVSRGGQILLVGTKRQAQEVVVEEATRASQFYVVGRWLGGTLTNFRTMKVGIDRLRSLEQMEEDGTLETLTKKEALGLRRERDRLQKFVGGVKEMNGLPAALFVIDPNHEHIAVSEANKLRIPVVALTDTNCDPDKIDYLIPGNDDAIRSIKLISAAIADASIFGQQRRRDFMQSGRKDDNSSGVQIEFARSRGNRPDANSNREPENKPD